MSYYAAPLSRKNIREIAMSFRRYLGLENRLPFPIVRVLETIDLWIPGFYCAVEAASSFKDPHVHAVTDFDERCVRLREDIYIGACEHNGRDRMTLAHELGHVVLISIHGIRLYKRKGDGGIKPYRDPEWQANCFAGELMAPKHLVAGMPPKEIAALGGISPEAAVYQSNRYQEEEGISMMNARK